MKVGEKIYYINSALGIDLYEIIDINCNNIVSLRSCLIPEICIEMTKSEVNSSQRIFFHYDCALMEQSRLKEKYKEKRNSYFDSILEEALNSVTLDEVERNGTLLRSLEKDKTNEFYKALLYEYNNKKYIIIYKYTEKDENGKYKRKECIKFIEK